MLVKRSAILVVFVILALILMGMVVNSAVTGIWSSWVNYKPPVDVKIHLKSDNYTRIADYVVVILVDGARPDTVNEIGDGGFKFVRERGVLFSNAYALLPTYSVPARAAISTGLPHEISGVSSNWYNGGVLKAPNMFSLAKRFGLKTAAVGDNSIKMLFGDYLDTFVQIPEVPGQMYKATEEAIKIINGSQPPNLLWIGFADIDEAGHEYGASSNQYKEAVMGASKSIMNIVNALNARGILERTFLVVISDHGHLSTGGHGGSEIEVRRIYLSIMGPGVKNNAIINRTVYYTSVASTIAFVLGLPPELVSYDLPLFDAFNRSIAESKSFSAYETGLTINYAYHLEDLFRSVGLDNYVKNVSEIINEVEVIKSSGNVTLVLNYHSRLISIYENSKNDLVSKNFVMRIGSAILIGLITWLPTVLMLYLSGRMFWKSVVGGLIGVIVFWISFIYIFRFLPTMSSVNSLDSYIISIMMSTLLSIIVSALIMAVLLNVKNERKAVLFLSPLFVIISVSSVPILIMGFVYGFTVRFPFPDWNLAYMYYTSLLNEMFLMLFSGLMPLIIFIGLILRSRITKLK